MSLRLHLIAEEPQLRQALRTLFDREPDLVVVAEADGTESACARVASAPPDVLVVDADLCASNALELTRAVKARSARARVLLLAGHPTPDGVHAALLAGASGVAGKVQPPRELVGAVRVVGQGGCYVAPRMITVIETHDEVRALLSDRELAVYERLVAGRPDDAIARDLCLSPRTVRSVRGRILQKLGAASPADLMRVAMTPAARRC
jgi:DNA-binding NarL/FixJ family response regulator